MNSALQYESVIMMIVGVKYIAAGVASCIRRSVNLVTITLLAIPILKERVSIPKFLAMFLATGR